MLLLFQPHERLLDFRSFTIIASWNPATLHEAELIMIFSTVRSQGSSTFSYKFVEFLKKEWLELIESLSKFPALEGIRTRTLLITRPDQ